MKHHRMPDYDRSNDTSEVGTLINTGIDKCLDLKYGEGITDFNKALELDPENFEALYNKAIALLKWGFDGFVIGSTRYAAGIEILTHLLQNGEELITEAKGFLENFINLHHLRL